MAKEVRKLRLVRRAAPEPTFSFSAAQRQVIEHRASPLVVYGGPGSGKTTTLIESAISRVRQTSLVAVLFGILTFNNQKKERTLPSKVLEIASPFSAFVVIPVFVFISLFRHFDFSSRTTGATLVLSLIIVRLIGKPLGIFLGIMVGKYLTRISLPFSRSEALLIGALGTLGLDVSLIFAQRDFTGLLQNQAITGILLTIPAGIILSLIVHFVNRRFSTKSEKIL